jgi:hypothetical protein
MEVDAAARKYDSKQMVDRAIATAKQTFASDPQAALAGLQDAIEQMPGEERLIDYERSLRQQADALRAQQLLSDALRNAREFIAARQPDKAVTALEAYELEHGNQADVSELLKYARKELAEQQARAVTERTIAMARALRAERPDEAIRVLEAALKDPAIQASGDTSLQRLLDDIREQQAAVARKLDVVQKRATLLRERGQLDEAIAVLKEFLDSGAKSAAAQEMLNSLQAEAEIKQITAKALASAAASAEQGKFPAAFDALQSVVRAYGESDELTRATEQVKAVRALYAQQVITRSIETSRAALLANDVPGAMAALRTANEMVEYADPAKQADWRRIGQAAKKAEAEPPAAGAVIADPLADLGEAETQKRIPPAALYGGIAVVCVLLGVVGFMVMRKPPAAPAGPTDAHISIAKAPPGAMVSIDSGAGKPTDANGALTVTVQPGKHVLEVTMAGYDPYTENIPVGAGETFHESIAMSKAVAANKAGTLVMQGNIAGFKVMVDGKPHGEILKKDGTLTLEEGSHTIRYSNEDNTDNQEHTITIVAGKSTPDSFTLKAPVPVVVAVKPNTPAPAAMGSLVVETTPNAQVAIDGQPKGSADGSGKLTVGSLSAGNHSVEISLDKYQPINGRSVTIAGGQAQHFAQPLTLLPPAPPSTGGVSVQTTANAQISIDGQRKGSADGSGQFNLEGLSPGQHSVEVSLEHYQSNQVSFGVRAGSSSVVAARLQPEAVAVVAPKPVAPTPAAAVDNSADIAGIQEALRNFEQAYDSRNMGRISANWLNIGGRAKSIAGVMQQAEMVNIHEACEGQPSISGTSATQSCTEVVQYTKGDAPRKFPKSITFSKVGGKWVMKDKTP